MQYRQGRNITQIAMSFLRPSGNSLYMYSVSVVLHSIYTDENPDLPPTSSPLYPPPNFQDRKHITSQINPQKILEIIHKAEWTEISIVKCLVQLQGHYTRVIWVTRAAGVHMVSHNI